MASRSGPPSEKVHKMQGRDHRPGRRERASQGQGQWHPQGCPPAPRRRSRWSPGVAPRRPVCPASGLRAAALGGEGHHAESPPAAQSRGRPGFLGPSDPCLVRGVGESEARGQARPEGSEPPNGLVASPAGPPGLVPSAAWRPSAGRSAPSSPRPRAPGTRVRQRENVCLGESRLVTLGEPTLGAWLVGDLRHLSLDPSLTSPPECPLPGAVRLWATFASLHP